MGGPLRQGGRWQTDCPVRRRVPRHDTAATSKTGEHGAHASGPREKCGSAAAQVATRDLHASFQPPGAPGLRYNPANVHS